ncbi:MAG: hypothetical protein ACKVJR_06880 [Flavobacteriales bacterium]
MRLDYYIYCCFLFTTFSIIGQQQRNLDEILPTRQVHLDFHTSEQIPNIGSEFDKKQFQSALIEGKINQVNIFSKGHHGYSYYPTKIGTMHPNLDFDLLGAQLEACHEIGVKAPFYFTIGWSVLDAEQHPEWVMKDPNGEPLSINIDYKNKPEDKRPHYSWESLDPTPGGPYHAYILKNVEEICKRYENLDGFWFDIYHIKHASFTDYSKVRMLAQGIDLTDTDAVEKSYALALKLHMKELRTLVNSYHPEATVFFNQATHITKKPIFQEALYKMNTHAELEDLPTTWGGYDKLPLEAKFHLGKNTPVVAMSGKFHKAWGEFGGFKHADAIKFEAATMISFGASCNFGDQLHPEGLMDMETYRNIGEAYTYVEKIEDYGPGGKPISNLGVWLSLIPNSDYGIVKMLLQLHRDFVVADLSNLDDLDLIVLPSQKTLSISDAERLQKWVSEGGKLIVFEKGAMLMGSEQFGIDLGAQFISDSAFDFDFTVVKPELGFEVVSTPFVNYDSGIRTKLTNGNSIAMIREPYFNRTYKSYSSHRETPYKAKNSIFPAVVRTDNTIFFAHQIDQLYFNHGMRIHRQLFENAIMQLDYEPLLKVNNLPSAGKVSLLNQENKNRFVVHLLYSPPLLRANNVEVIEDFVEIRGVNLELDLDRPIKKVYQIPDGKSLDFDITGGLLKVKVPPFTMHSAVVFEY